MELKMIVNIDCLGYRVETQTMTRKLSNLWLEQVIYIYSIILTIILVNVPEPKIPVGEWLKDGVILCK
jgi:hypothetical protein